MDDEPEFFELIKPCERLFFSPQSSSGIIILGDKENSGKPSSDWAFITRNSVGVTFFIFLPSSFAFFRVIFGDFKKFLCH